MERITPELRDFVEKQLGLGRYAGVDEVIDAALRLLASHERRFSALDEAVRRGIEDAGAGAVSDLDPACEGLLAELAALPAARVAP